MRPGGTLMRTTLWAAVLMGAVSLPFFLDPRGYLIRVLSLSLLFAAMSQAWNIVGGLASQISLGHAAFFGIGAYTSTLLLINFGITPWLGMIAGGLLGAAAAVLIGVPAMRLQGHYFALATLAFGEVLRAIANTWSAVTGGPSGISVPFAKPGLIVFQFQETRSYFWLILGALVAVTLVFALIKESKLGFRLRALRENPDAAEATGVDTTQTKILAAVISGALTAMLGTFYAQFQFFFDPDTVFSVGSISVRVAMIAIVGGIGTVTGPIIGALFLIPLEELVNSLLDGRAAGLPQLVFGALLIAVILVEPHGLQAIGSRLRRFLSLRGAT
jgi:branched-chain amino acid transport system permease protein